LVNLLRKSLMLEGYKTPMISISVVSHEQADLVGALLQDLVKIAEETPIEVLLTKNLPEKTPDVFFPSNCILRVIENREAQGFGHNHNAAFAAAKGDFFCVLNPDIRLSANPFPVLLNTLADHLNAIAVPQILGPEGHVQDSVRHFPTLWRLIKRVSRLEADHIVPSAGATLIPVDWAAGMFLLMRSKQYAALGGFDQRYFLYCEDVDLSARVWKSGKRVVLCTQAIAIHDARRTSHGNFKYLTWHLTSYVRYFIRHSLRPPRAARARVEAELGQ